MVINKTPSQPPIPPPHLLRHQPPPLLQERRIILQPHCEHPLRDAVRLQVLRQHFLLHDGAVAALASLALLQEMAEIILRGLVPNLDIDFRLHIDVVGNLVVLRAAKALLFQQILGEDVMDIAPVLHQFPHGDVLGEEALVAAHDLRCEEHEEKRAVRQRGQLERLNEIW